MWIELRIREHLDREWAFGMFGIMMFAICTPVLVMLSLVSSRHQEEIPCRQTLFSGKLMDIFLLTRRYKVRVIHLHFISDYWPEMFSGSH
ncbi:hypothetical protein RSAG8_07917, partial [Rhizoctonia solani AG-8 WAC10335]